MAKKHVFRVTFMNEGKVYEVYCQKVSQSAMFGFVELEGLLFGEKSSVVVDPSEERLKTEFAGVGRTYIPLHAVVRIDEVEKRGTSNIRAVTDRDGKVAALPSSVYTPRKRD